MDKKLRIKHRKKENKYIVDYSKVLNKENTRFDLISHVNKDNEIIVFIDTSLNKIPENSSQGHYFDLCEESSKAIVENFLEESKLNFRLRIRKRHEAKAIFGFATGKTILIEDVLLAIILPKATLTKELFEYVMCTHDYMIGISSEISSKAIIESFANNEFDRIDESLGFKYTLLDSHWMEYFYTNYSFEI